MLFENAYLEIEETILKQIQIKHDHTVTLYLYGHVFAYSSII